VILLGLFRPDPLPGYKEGGRNALNSAFSGGDEQWAQWLVDAQRGDGEAYRRFLIAAVPFIETLARRRLRSPEGIEDVVQDTLLTVHRIRHTYEPGKPVKPWLAAIASRRTVDLLRRTGRQRSREVADPIAYETFADPAANQEQAAAAPQEVAQLMQALSPKQKEAIELVKLREMSLVEASAASGQTVASLKVNIHRAVQKLRGSLDRGQVE
jgi:RNA polymerase sigma-70 factor, ECF subfamily